MAGKNIKSMRIILELLHNPKGNLTKYRLSKLTETNISWIIQFLRRLEEKKLVKNTKVINFDKLIDFYLELDKKHTIFDFYMQQPFGYLKKLRIDYMLTTYSAENLVSHHLFPSRNDIYVKEKNLQKMKKDLFNKGLVGKGNIRLIVSNDDYIFKFMNNIKGFSVVSIPLLLIDLKREGGVCMEAYEYLVKKYVQR